MLKFFKKRIFKKMSADGNSTVQDPNEQEILFGSSTEKEKEKSKKHSKRRTALYIPGFRKSTADIKYSDVKTSDGQLIVGQEVEWTELDDTMIESLGASGIWGADSVDGDIISEADLKSKRVSRLVRGHSFNGFLKKDLEKNKENIKLNSTICGKDYRDRNREKVGKIKSCKENCSFTVNNSNKTEQERTALDVSIRSKCNSKGKKLKKSPFKTLENTGVVENKLHGSEKQLTKQCGLKEKSSGAMSVRSLSFKSPKKRPSPENKENFSCVETSSYSSPNIKLECSYVLDSPHQLVSPQARYPKEKISPDFKFEAKPGNSMLFSNSNSAFKSYKLIKSSSCELSIHNVPEGGDSLLGQSKDIVKESIDTETDSDDNCSSQENIHVTAIVGESEEKKQCLLSQPTCNVRNFKDSEKRTCELTCNVNEYDQIDSKHVQTSQCNDTPSDIGIEDGTCVKSTDSEIIHSHIISVPEKETHSSQKEYSVLTMNKSSNNLKTPHSFPDISDRDSALNSNKSKTETEVHSTPTAEISQSACSNSVSSNMLHDSQSGPHKSPNNEDELEFEFKKPDYSLLPSVSEKYPREDIKRIKSYIHENSPSASCEYLSEPGKRVLKGLDYDFLSQLNKRLHILEKETCDRVNYLEDSEKPDYSLLPNFSSDSISHDTRCKQSTLLRHRDVGLNMSCDSNKMLHESHKSKTLPYSSRKTKVCKGLKASVLSNSFSGHETMNCENKFSLRNALEDSDYNNRPSKAKLQMLSDSIHLQRSRLRHSDRPRTADSKLHLQKEQNLADRDSHNSDTCRNSHVREKSRLHQAAVARDITNTHNLQHETKQNSNTCGQPLNQSLSNLSVVNDECDVESNFSETDIDATEHEEELVAPLSVSYAGNRTEEGQNSTPDILLFNRPEIKTSAPRTVQTNVDEFFTGTLVTCQPATATTRKIVYENLDTSSLNQSGSGREKKATVRKISKLQKTTLEHVQNYLDEDPLSTEKPVKHSHCPRSPLPRKVSHMSRRARDRSPSPTFSPSSPCGSTDSSSSLEDFFDTPDWSLPQSPDKKGRNSKMPYSKFRERNRKRDEPYSRPDSYPPTTENNKLSDQDLELITRLHTLCNGQRVVRYLNFMEAPMMIKHYPPPKEASRISWCENIAVPLRTPTATPCKIKPEPKPILQQRSENSIFPYMEDVPSPIVITKTRRSSSLGRRAKRKQKSFAWNP